MSTQVSDASILAGPSVSWRHVDGPLLTWAGEIHWLTWWERICLYLKQKTLYDIACDRWPHLELRHAMLRGRS